MKLAKLLKIGLDIINITAGFCVRKKGLKKEIFQQSKTLSNVSQAFSFKKIADALGVTLDDLMK